MPFRLADINQWQSGMGCAPTALCAISGRTPNEMGLILSRAAASVDVVVPPHLLPNYRIDHWLPAIGLLGGRYVHVSDLAEVPIEARPTIPEWMQQTESPDVSLVYCE